MANLLPDSQPVYFGLCATDRGESMQMPGRYANDGYRFGFQGQEMDNELKGTGNSINYKYRMHDPRIGRFFAVDPLYKKYPWNSPYAFSENRVIDAVELEGLEAFLIHGTTSNNKRWANKDGSIREGTKQLLRLQSSKYYNTGFEWGGIFNYGNNYFNDVEDRRRAARKLVNYVMEHRIGGEDVTLIGHSHGGNVGIQAAPMLRAALDNVGAEDVRINLITVATPAVNNPDSPENPVNSFDAINSHIHIYNIQDKVQKDLANSVDGENYEHKYKNDKTYNAEIDVSKIYKEKTTDAHSVDYDKPELIKENIDNGTIPKTKW